MTRVKFNSPLGKSIDSMVRDFFNDAPVTFKGNDLNRALHFPPVNITETEDAFILELSVPGFEKEDFLIGMDGRILNIGAETAKGQEEAAGKMIRREFSARRFKRSFSLDEIIDETSIDAGYEKGILSIRLPKKVKEDPKQRSITVK